MFFLLKSSRISNAPGYAFSSFGSSFLFPYAGITMKAPSYQFLDGVRMRRNFPAPSSRASSELYIVSQVVLNRSLPCVMISKSCFIEGDLEQFIPEDFQIIFDIIV